MACGEEGVGADKLELVVVVVVVVWGGCEEDVSKQVILVKEQGVGRM